MIFPIYHHIYIYLLFKYRYIFEYIGRECVCVKYDSKQNYI